MTKRIKKKAEINIIPYVDVMLLLVIILAISCAGILPSIVKLPSFSQKPQKQSVIEQAIVWIKPDGSFLLSWNKQNAKNMSFDGLIDSIKEKEQAAAVQVLVAADKKTPYELVIQTMSQLKKNNIEQISLLLKSSG